MKLAVLVCGAFACAAISACGASAAFIPLAALGPFHHDLSDMDQADLAYLRQQYAAARPKRSGSGDALNSLKSSLGQGIKSKLGMLGKASSGHFSGGSPHYYHQDDMKPPFDLWGFKKSVLYTLLQAVKAIKGGVIAIKGQLIKGGGQLLATKGKIIKGGGQALSDLGKSIATSAFMLVPQDDYEEHYEHVAPSSYGHSGPGPESHHHSAPSGPGPEYGPPGYHQKYNSVYDGKHEHDGIVILKKIPGHGHGHGGHGHHGEHEGQETKATEFKPLKDDSYSGLTNFMSSVYSASAGPKHEYPQPPPPQHSLKQYEYPQLQHQQLQKDQDNSEDVPATSYGVPIGPKVKYPEYYQAPAPILQHNPPKMFVTPSPPPSEPELPITYKLELPKNQHQNIKDSQLFIGMNVPLGDYQQLAEAFPAHTQEYLQDFSLAPTPYSQQIPTKFLINYPDATELLLRDAYPQPSRHAPKRVPPPSKHRPPHRQQQKKSPNLDVLRSVAFELRPDRQTLKY